MHATTRAAALATILVLDRIRTQALQSDRRVPEAQLLCHLRSAHCGSDRFVYRTDHGLLVGIAVPFRASMPGNFN